ncbi:LysM domain-containing protein [Paucibacter sp. PLA-PC-4]|uniref:LysM peptidoglycan-binding domain-containing protein n=1 Tax=Paucibacter sp. PLA-PC-4 TaxID=2993655 RepID=UPI00224AAB90|nr:LysM domain-containing protein [Paucibacter sp. PLA-PC-4]MCX2864887.1 LysM domain-containing protein [Paucibacter sp. PLA-PC-4]
MSLPKFPANSRYASTETTRLVGPDGAELVYLKRRFLPQPERLALWRAHSVVQGDRLDNLAARYLSDPELWWRIADANRAMRPDDLLQPVGRVLKLSLPDGVPGAGVPGLGSN